MTASDSIRFLFDPLKRTAGSEWPSPGSLARELTKKAGASRANKVVPSTPQLRSLFATAAVEMWHRGVHSFLISASLTSSSPIWSSVAGYYSSHYAVRAIAHVLGTFQAYSLKKIARIDSAQCALEEKNSRDREHVFYWKFVSDHFELKKDPFFYPNSDLSRDGSVFGDSAHRNHANYHDHVHGFPTFTPLSLEKTKERVQRISKIEFSAVPVPSVQKFPDLDSVQVLAYHRLVKFRTLVNEALGEKNRFWNVHKSPAWGSEVISYQIVDPTYAGVYKPIA